jgi:hypothetical protein
VVPLSTFIEDGLLDAFFSLYLSELSSSERMLLSGKIPLIAASVKGEQQILGGIVEGINSKTLRSKLITLIMCFRHKAIMAGFAAVEQAMIRSSASLAPELTMAQVKQLVARSDDLVNDIIFQSKLALH